MTNIEMRTMEASLRCMESVRNASTAISRHLDSEALWEQRRYEIARDLYVQYATMTATQCIDKADELIKELKRRDNG